MLWHELHQIEITDDTIEYCRNLRAIICHASQRKVPADRRDCIYCSVPSVIDSPVSKAW